MTGMPKVPAALDCLSYQPRVREFLAAAVHEGRISQAYLFVGPLVLERPRQLVRWLSASSARTEGTAAVMNAYGSGITRTLTSAFLRRRVHVATS